MKNLKLIFGVLLVAGFFATIALSSSSNEQAIKKSELQIPRNG